MTIKVRYFQGNSQTEEKLVYFKFFALSSKKDGEKDIRINIKTSSYDEFFLVSKEKIGLAKILNDCFLERQDCTLELISTKNGLYLDMIHMPIKPILTEIKKCE
jgi:hypothetical protein